MGDHHRITPGRHGDLLGGAGTFLDHDADMLTFKPRSSDPPIPPGGFLSVFFVATGPIPSLLSCTFDGTACA
ncbi:MAG: hypothetical protein ACM3ML_30265 [Micromonosporaceae bacterium]